MPPKDYLQKIYEQKNPECLLDITLVDAQRIGTDPNTAQAGVRKGAFAGPLGGQSFKRDPKKTIPAQDEKITLLREVVAGAIAGSFQPVTCQGDIGFASLREAAAGFGKLARARYIAKTKSGSTYVSNHVSGGFETKSENRKDECKTTRIIGKSSESTVNPLERDYNASAYRARPLTGIWSSAPYLHNGSIPTLYDLLTPAIESDGTCSDPEDRCRPITFNVGSSEFDAKHVGFKDIAGPNTTLIDTRLSGNHNSGHEFKIGLSHEERLALIEYLKSL